jgi:Protein of unknown function (DUF1592)/Protein of unknown function (DUF1588)/Protein of unknown function (DUF1595)/Protein of unknown function (DUF1585)/Protein of unknown function (DUF1587)
MGVTGTRGHDRRAAWRRLAVGSGAALLLAASACTGLIGEDGSGVCEGPGCNGPIDPESQAVASLETTRFARLSHLQWENTVRDLFYLDTETGLSGSFTGDPLGGIFDNNAQVMLVAASHWGDYQSAAESVSEQITADQALLEKILPADLPADQTEAARAFITSFGKRAYRRPLSDAEIDRHVDVFNDGIAILEGGTDFEKGVRLSIQAFLQSPHFLYRVEASSETDADGLIVLSGWEIAAKLSYMLWNTMPDDTLFAAVEAGELATPEGILAQSQRMFDADSDAAHAMIGSFHEQLYQFDHYHDLYKDPAIFPTFTPELGLDMEQEAKMFIDDVVFDDGGLTELLTSRTTFVNAELAAIYGLEGDFDESFVEVTLDASERSGLLTRLGFLASNATPKEQNTIHRGVFVNLRVMCNTLPSPPDNVDGLPPSGDFDTNRERVDAHTGVGTCGASCHANLINPPGFALENFNAVGAYQELENGAPVDSSTSWVFDGTEQPVADAAELSQLIAGSEQAHACYTMRLLEYGYGRLAQDGDDKTIEELATASRAGSIKSLVLALTQTKAFRTRAAQAEEN